MKKKSECINVKYWMSSKTFDVNRVKIELDIRNSSTNFEICHMCQCDLLICGCGPQLPGSPKKQKISNAT